MIEVEVVQVFVPAGVLVVEVVLLESRVVLGQVYKIFRDQLAELFLVS